MYVLVRDDGAYVARPGSRSSYTLSLQAARVFATREAAEADRCPENELIVAVSALLRPEVTP